MKSMYQSFCTSTDGPTLSSHCPSSGNIQGDMEIDDMRCIRGRDVYFFWSLFSSFGGGGGILKFCSCQLGRCGIEFS